MSLHLSDQSLERFRRGELSAGELAALDEHLAGCPECGRRVAGGTGGDATRASLRSAARDDFAHLRFEEMEALVNGALGEVEREIAETHLSVCLACAEDVADLRSFRQELAAATPRPSEAPAPAPRPAKARLLERLCAALWPSSPGFSPSYALAAIALLLAFASLVFFALRQSEERPREMVNINAPTPDIAQVIRPTPAPNPTPVESPTPEAAGPRLALEDGAGTVGLDASGELIGLEGLAPAERRQVKEALAGGRIDASAALGGIPGRQGSLMGARSEGVPFRLRGPVGLVLRSRRPTLSWEPLEGASAYTVTLVDESGRVAARSPELKGTSWKLPTDLARGATYSWQVTAQKGGAEVVSPAPPAPEARFKILDDDAAASIARVERDARGSHLALGVVYARAGLLDEAERELRALLRRNPRSELARRLLQSVRAQRTAARAKK